MSPDTTSTLCVPGLYIEMLSSVWVNVPLFITAFSTYDIPSNLMFSVTVPSRIASLNLLYICPVTTGFEYSSLIVTVAFTYVGIALSAVVFDPVTLLYALLEKFY